MEADIIYDKHVHEQLLPGAEEEAEFGEFCFSLYLSLFKLTNGLIPAHNKLNNSRWHLS